jgi:hypothetical protein
MKNNKLGIIMVLSVFLILGGAVVFGKDTVERIRLGNEQADNGREHVSQAEAPEYGNEDPHTSGDHGDPVPQQAYTTELPDYNTIHNLEHGYIYITYQPDLPQEEIDKLTDMFFKPYDDVSFAPTKVIMAPRASNTSPIVFSSWNRSLSFDAYDQQQMMDYYLGNVSKSPEPIAG